ncbi:L-aspartate oxidase, partial [Mycobacterium rufum]|nr:L-aspartate oxidase [Mycolicibacterium rufum]
VFRNRRFGAAPASPTRPVLARPVLQQTMSRHASVVRDDTGLGLLIDRLDTATPRIITSRTMFEDAALTTVAGALAAAARARTETRGSHHRRDFPDTDPAQAASIVCGPVTAGCA